MSSGVAPFVFLDSLNYEGIFSDNGFLLNQKNPSITVHFTTDSMGVVAQDFQDGLVIR